MAEFRISRFRYTWKDTWTGNSTPYNKDDVVYYQGSSWVCIRQHTSGQFHTDQTYTAEGTTQIAAAWVKMTEGREFKGNWTAGLRYEPNTFVRAGGNVYICITSHAAAANFNSDSANWELFAVGSNFRDTWSATTIYRVGDVVRYNGYTYQCILEHVSSTTTNGIELGNNDSNGDSTAETWSVLIENYMFVGEYSGSTLYRKNDLVRYGASILKCITYHQSPLLVSDIDNTKFVIYLPGFQFSKEWNSSQYYASGDVVKYAGIIYVATANSFQSQPGLTEVYSYGLGNPDWIIINKGIAFIGEYDYQGNYAYKQGDIVRRGGSLWVSLSDQYTDDSSLRVFDDSNWELVISAQNFTGSWRNEKNYNFYDVVYFKGAVYYANTPHQSSFDNFPGDNGSGFFYWTVVLLGDENAALTILGDLLTYKLQKNLIEDGSTSFLFGDESSFGPTPVAVGTPDQLLVVSNNNGDISYRTWGNVQRVFFVRKSGVDDVDPDRGTNYFKPYKTLRYALEKADDGYQGLTSIKLSTGEYSEILPLSIPTRTAVIGEELRATTIRASSPVEEYINDIPYVIILLVRLSTILVDIIQGEVIIPSVGNVEDQILPTYTEAGNQQAVDNILADIIGMINFLANGQGAAPIVVGSNTISSISSRLTAGLILEDNRIFLKAEVVAYMAASYPNYSFNRDKYQSDFDKFINAIQYDLRYTGNYKSMLAVRVYVNEAQGSQAEDMFYVRDTTGLRNMTLKGLSGTLPELQEGEVYQIPTGGSFVSLDPGWGPADQRMWILNRSCYVQNVTTFGTAAIGQKIDGSLHNGGNRSITSNDFTQVISDGIGAWVQNGGRGELVSVFSYYAHIGMFAKNGGIIRATNGNSSYGDFGAVADGIDTNETVRYAYLNTRTEQATVASAFAGEIQDFILALEFENCGQEYTTANYTFVSSGSGATVVQEEFRDDAMFECQLLQSGSGFRQYGNQAQAGDATTIQLAAAETATPAQIETMRIIIISGEGTGQYGYVQDYNPATKICTVYRESDNQLGWDHILPGTPANLLLTSGTRYRIEPRVTFSLPEYSTSTITLPTANTWAALAYGETTQVFAGVSGQIGSGTTDDVTPVAAIFTVTKIGRSYSVSISSPGAGYALNDQITIDGADIGGVSGENDIAFQVTNVSDDSTNSIVQIAFSGDNAFAQSGKFVLIPATGHFGRYSSDGETWSSFDLPSDGNWKCLAPGNNMFVAIKYGSDNAASSSNGIDWTARSMPSSRNWNAVIFGKSSTLSAGIFVAVASNLNTAAYSVNGVSWSASTLPTIGDSTLNEWIDIAFGYDKFVAIANSGNIAAVGTWNGTVLSWQGTIMDAVADSSAKDWVSVAYGNRRFVAVSSTGDVAYSFDGFDWLAAAMPSQDGSTAHNWQQIRYSQGVFFAVGNTGSRTIGSEPTAGPTAYSATSYDGIVWTDRTLSAQANWGLVTFGNPDVTLGDSTLTNNKGTWIVAPTTSSVLLSKVYTGAQILGRVVVGGIGISAIKIWEPGSGYTAAPTVALSDPSKLTDATIRPRLADKVLAQPTFLSKGTAYKTSTTSISVSGDGFADKTPNGRFLTLDGLTVMPGPGAQFYIAGSSAYRVAVVVGINEILFPNATIRSTFQISPKPRLADFLEHGMEVLIREKYSQVRLTGHDFLDIGTGNFEETNYPNLYTNYEYTTQPFQEVQNLNGGRVFYTSTDQDGNFRAGEQFAVEQSTGVITISADFFDLDGLTELRLSGINVGSTAVIREFSKDALFLQNSNNVIATQRAIRSYLGARLNVGGEDLLTPSITGGTVKLGPDGIDSTVDFTINIPVMVNFAGPGSGVSGSMLSQIMFNRSFNNNRR